jgi:hypothetical protein
LLRILSLSCLTYFILLIIDIWVQTIKP